MAESHHANHVTPLKVYLTVGMLLFILTGLTVGISRVHLGPWNAIVALAIASVKGLLVVLFFMHLFYDKKIFAFIVSVALVMLAILIGLTMADVLRRGDIYENQAYPIHPQAKIYGHSSGDTLTVSHDQAIKDTTGSNHNTKPADSIEGGQEDTNPGDLKTTEIPKSAGGAGH